MTFLAPMMLAGAGAIGVPIALHFFYKARYRRLPWAAMDFLKEAIEQTSRRLKFQEWILLAIRCLVILLLVLAHARLGSESAGVAGRGDAIDAVFVIDTSYSMGVKEGEPTRLQQAQEAALGVINSLPPNSTVQIFTCADRTEFIGPVSRYNLDQARQLIPTIQTSGLSTDFQPGLAAALEAVESGTAPVKEIYLFSDLQKTGFERQPGAIREKCEEIRKKANLVFVRCGNEARKVLNVAIIDITIVGTIPHSKTRVPFVISLKNTGTETVTGIKVGLELDGKAVEDVVQVDQIEPGQVLPVTLTGSLEEAGPQVLTARVAGDGLPGDNRFDKVLLVRDVIRVLIVDGTPNPQSPAEAGSHFVRNALTPVPEERTEEYYIRPLVVTPTEAGSVLLTDKDVVYLLNVPASPGGDGRGGLPGDFVTRLKEFVSAGGGLIIGCGDQVVPAEYNHLFGSGGAGLLPFDLTPGDPLTARDTEPFTPAPETVETPSFLSQFRDPPYSHALRGVGISKLFGVEETGPGAVGGRVLIRTADTRPFISSRVVGEGEVVFVGTTLDERWTTFPGKASDAFIPFTQFTLAHLTGRKVPGGNKIAGETLVWSPADPAGAFELVKPPRTGEKVNRRVGLEKPTLKPGEKLTLTTSDTADPGIYHMVREGQAEALGPVFAVNADLRESVNLDMATVAQMTKLLGFEPAIIQAGAGTEAAVYEHRVHREWTEWFLLLALFVVVGETAWAWVCGKAW